MGSPSAPQASLLEVQGRREARARLPPTHLLGRMDPAQALPRESRPCLLPECYNKPCARLRAAGSI